MAGCGGREGEGCGEAWSAGGARVEGGIVGNRSAPGAGGDTGDGAESDSLTAVGVDCVGPG